jgi:hypothetical protein
MDMVVALVCMCSPLDPRERLRQVANVDCDFSSSNNALSQLLLKGSVST